MAAHPTQTEQSGPADPAESARRYFNRELSWLAFNDRVLEEACNPRHPLLERLRFLSISGNNLDEFFMVRVAGLVGQVAEHVEERSADGRTPAQQLVEIERAVDRLNAAQQQVWSDLRAELATNGVVEADVDDLDDVNKAWLREHFVTQIFPVLTPQALDPAHPFPFIPNKGLSLIFDLKRRSDGKTVRELVMLPATMPRFVRIAGDKGWHVALEKIVVAFADKLFPGYDVRGSGLFRIIRDNDIEVEEEAEDLVLYFRNALKRRKRGQVI
ncbi:MAG: RNA degradosome polyphosphate kinase, partial [Blastomonas fulva]